MVFEDMDGENRCKVVWEVLGETFENQNFNSLKNSPKTGTSSRDERGREGGIEKAGSVLHYIVERKEGRGSQRVKVVQQVVKAPPLWVEDLQEGVEYEFKVMACNAYGTSASSDSSMPFTHTSKGRLEVLEGFVDILK